MGAARGRGCRLGIDFDNTVVRYDELLLREAGRRGLIPPETMAWSKREIRDRIRRLPEGEREWQRLQALIYGAKIQEATPAPGVAEFFARCKAHAVEVFIISHKTRYAALDERGIDLWDAAMAWMRSHRLFDAEGAGLSPQRVYFEPTRAEKLARIKRLGCTHFIDDLEETFLEPAFPQGTQKILYATAGPSTHLPGVRVAASWQDITEGLFDAGP
ncbi:MAG: hypothetical protein HY002_18420 [Candidatus Rokubacteria bacterium]|nr:hypothetical protein [Candidatus Rokubacteria bacterium]